MPKVEDKPPVQDAAPAAKRAQEQWQDAKLAETSPEALAPASTIQEIDPYESANLEKLAHKVFDATDGLFTKDEVLTEVFRGMDLEQLQKLAEVYQAQHHQNMFYDLTDDLSDIDLVNLLSGVLTDRATLWTAVKLHEKLEDGKDWLGRDWFAGYVYRFKDNQALRAGIEVFNVLFETDWGSFENGVREHYQGNAKEINPFLDHLIERGVIDGSHSASYRPAESQYSACQTSTKVRPGDAAQVQSLDRLAMTVHPVNISTEQALETLNQLRSLSEQELMGYLSAERVSQMTRDGSLFLAGLAIESHDRLNAIERSGSPDRWYRERIENFRQEGELLSEKIKIAKNCSLDEVKLLLAEEPYHSFFEQEFLPAVNMHLDELSEGQVRAVFEICILEKQVRDASIKYSSGAGFRTVLRDESDPNRSGDCNTNALYYAALASYSGSALLQESIRAFSTFNHAQIFFDLGTDAEGHPVKISKNTSYVNMERVGPDGSYANAPRFQQNFYDPNFDFLSSGVSEDHSNLDVSTLVQTLFKENARGGSLSRMSIDELKQVHAVSEELIDQGCDVPNILSGYSFVNLELLRRGAISKSLAKSRIEPVIAKEIEVSYFAGFRVDEFIDHFGREAARPLIDKLDRRIMEDPDTFRSFTRSPIAVMRAIPKFDGRVSSTESTLTNDINSRLSLLNTMKWRSNNADVSHLYYEEEVILISEKRTWK